MSRTLELIEEFARESVQLRNEIDLLTAQLNDKLSQAMQDGLRVDAEVRYAECPVVGLRRVITVPRIRIGLYRKV